MIETMVRRHMLREGGILVFTSIPLMKSDPDIVMVNFHRRIRMDDLCLFTLIVPRNRVIMPVTGEVNMVIKLYFNSPEGSQLILIGRQRF